MIAPVRPELWYAFRRGAAECRGATAEVVGNKAANLIRMADAGLPVPPGFVLSTALCRAYHQDGQRLAQPTIELLGRGIQEIEKATGLFFGGDRRPLLVAVRSGAPASMPGMLDTLLDVGLCERTLPALIRMTGNPRHAWDSYRRLVQTYAEVVHGLSADPFERLLGETLSRESVPAVTELDVAALKDLTQAFLDHYQAAKGEPFPQDPMVQLQGAAAAVFHSWDSARAVEYRRLHALDDLVGTAVTVQAMVFGNMGGTSGAGVGFTRDPASGAKTLYLDFLANAQGEDVVSGRCAVTSAAGLEQTMPELYRELLQTGRRLEALFRDAQDFEFTVQEGCLYLLQSRDAKRTAGAALRIACDQVAEGLIDEREAVRRLAAYDLAAIRNIRLAAAAECRPVGAGTPASPGVAAGEAVFEPAQAVALAAAGRQPILVRTDISTADIGGLAAAAGVLTARGGRTSHAAVVARQLNKVCIVGCRTLSVEAGGQRCRVGNQSFGQGSLLSLDGNSGHVYAGKLEVVVEQPTAYLEEVERWKARLAQA
jgi:pyruvate,orthophosphate dikinase